MKCFLLRSFQWKLSISSRASDGWLQKIALTLRYLCCCRIQELDYGPEKIPHHLLATHKSRHTTFFLIHILVGVQSCWKWYCVFLFFKSQTFCVTWQYNILKYLKYSVSEIACLKCAVFLDTRRTDYRFSWDVLSYLVSQKYVSLFLSLSPII